MPYKRPTQESHNEPKPTHYPHSGHKIRSGTINPGGHVAKLAVDVPKEVYDRAWALAEARGNSLSAELRMAILAHLDKHNA